MKKIAVFAGLAGLMLGLAGCNTVYAPVEPIRPVQPQPAGIEGSWVDANGIVSSFSNGAFETRTTDTNSVLATGTYRYINNNMVQIALHSRLRNTDSTVNCALVNPTQLNCTSSAGSQFSLFRSGAPVPVG
ncbi:MAG TPA: hypothetical protein VFJ18_06750 [Pararhizobium sp.]|nr:hypothetical protein [Pararhizobium sp.]